MSADEDLNLVGSQSLQPGSPIRGGSRSCGSIGNTIVITAICSSSSNSGGVFSQRDTHFRLSYATSDEKLARGLDVIGDLVRSPDG